MFIIIIIIIIFAVVLDTNKWFHQTDILGKEMSITIGSEYDWYCSQPLYFFNHVTLVHPNLLHLSQISFLSIQTKVVIRFLSSQQGFH